MNGSELSLWDKLKIAVTPVSHAEATVNEIYGPEGRGLLPVPQTYEPESAETPNVVVKTRQAVTGAFTKATATAQGVIIKTGIILFLAIAALVAIYAFVKR